jgi:hypothetical protein
MKPENETGTVFTAATTNHGNNENGLPTVPMMSAEGQKLAAKTAPQSATANSKTMSGGGPSNPLQDSLHKIFRGRK